MTGFKKRISDIGKKVNEEVRALYYSNYVNLEVILNMIGDDFLKYTINMSSLSSFMK